MTATTFDQPFPRSESRANADLRVAKMLVYTYGILILLEGALRKWYLPSLASPLLIIRDPVVIAAIFQTVRMHIFKWNIWLSLTVALACITSATAMLFGHQNWMITVFGLRSNYLHIPMIFIIGAVLDYQDVRKLIRVILWISVPMSILLYQQFHSPAMSWVNVGVGGKGTSTFDAAMGYRRPSGTFSFVTGVAQFYTLAASCLFATVAQNMGVSRILQALAGLAILAAIPFSISRLLFWGVCLVAVGTVFAVVIGRGRIGWLIQGFALLVILIAVSYFIPALEKPREVFMARWEVARVAEKGKGASQLANDSALGGALVRVFGGSADELATWQNVGPFGAGLGFGTNAASAMLSGGKFSFLIAEGEFARCLGELGFIFGFLFIGLRAGIAIMLFLRARVSAGQGNLAPMIFWFGAVFVLVQGQWGQPTAQGFGTFGAGLVLAAMRVRRPSDPKPQAPVLPAAPTPTPPLRESISERFARLQKEKQQQSPSES